MTFFGPNGRTRGRARPLCPPPSLATPLSEGHAHRLTLDDQRTSTETAFFVLQISANPTHPGLKGRVSGWGTFCSPYTPLPRPILKATPTFCDPKTDDELWRNRRLSIFKTDPNQQSRSPRGRGSGRGYFGPIMSTVTPLTKNTRHFTL